MNHFYSGMHTDLLGGGKYSCELGLFSEKLPGGGHLSHTRQKVLVRVTLLWEFSFEAETPRKAFRRNSSKGLLVRGGNFWEGLLGGTP